MLFLPFADFFKINLFEKLFQEYHQCHSLDLDQALCFVGPDLGPNCCKGYQQRALHVVGRVKDKVDSQFVNF